MRMFSGLEGSLEKYIEGFFKDSFGGRIQPADIAKKIAREMRDGKRVSISNIYVPNEYEVRLNPSDYENIATFSTLLSQELQEYVRQKANEKKYTLTGAPVVTFAKDEEVTPGHMRLDSEFSEAPPEEKKKAAPRETLEHTQRFTPVKEGGRPETASLVFARLEVNSGPDRGKVFNLSGVSMMIGRRNDCDIVLTDDSVSRHHARLELHRGSYTIFDLGSTNGVKVNGVKVASRVLEPEDIVSIGATLCAFKVE
ncbi:FhaA domain-containing protein [Pelotomaculum propionicicum]|uniref:Glycogen accumulation regulator GarA n=1 Tax=Pelotomaculum propionicicum TaxID=258475 RepID=A0A4Y7RPA4_9FIRM|nr:DUF3662 and FHA domain-containing protein [Pelotomaculum propionicicum]NLI11256.1 DUF3662 domain-containing protein [Peptococcaceae bacterium]TEB10570.1 Glycogen accumulation regulator GarA [Pelotomaculum propionicicum]